MTDQIYEIIKDRILRGYYPLGAPINISQITNELGASNSPIREALAKLEAESLVIKTNSRYQVISITDKFNEDLDQFLSMMIVGALDLCEKKNKLPQLSMELHSAFLKQLQLKETGSDYEYLCATINFDWTVIKVSENKVFESKFDELSKLVMLVVSNKHQNNADINLNEHRDILLAIDSMDIALARNLIIQHYDKPLSIYPLRESLTAQTMQPPRGEQVSVNNSF